MTDHTWRQTYFGIQLTQQEELQLSQILAEYSGGYLVCFDPFISQACIDHSKVKVKFYIAPMSAQNMQNSTLIVADYHELPLLSKRVDVVIAPHTFDFYSSPKKLAREVWRVLCPEGVFIVLGFNRNSFFGLPKTLSVEETGALALSPIQIRSALVAQGFHIEKFKTFFYRPIVKSKKWHEGLKFMEVLGSFLWPTMGHFYLIVARKPILGLTPLKLTVKNEKNLPKGVLEPTTFRFAGLQVNREKI